MCVASMTGIVWLDITLIGHGMGLLRSHQYRQSFKKMVLLMAMCFIEIILIPTFSRKGEKMCIWLCAVGLNNLQLIGK